MKQLRRLSGRRAARQDAGAYVIEGPVLLAEALAAGVEIREVFAIPDQEHEAVDAARGAGVTVHTVRADALAGAVDTTTPQGVAAVIGRVETPWPAALEAAAAGPLVLVLVDIGDPGNAGTLLRAAEASGASAVVFAGASVDPWHPKCARASAGALFHLPIALGGGADEVVAELGQAGVSTVATVVRGGTAYDLVDLTVPTAIVLGSEAHGLPDAVVAAATTPVTIPMAGRAESLNVAMAGSVLCFESLRQRRKAGG